MNAYLTFLFERIHVVMCKRWGFCYNSYTLTIFYPLIHLFLY